MPTSWWWVRSSSSSLNLFPWLPSTSSWLSYSHNPSFWGSRWAHPHSLRPGQARRGSWAWKTANRHQRAIDVCWPIPRWVDCWVLPFGRWVGAGTWKSGRESASKWSYFVFKQHAFFIRIVDDVLQDTMQGVSQALEVTELVRFQLLGELVGLLGYLLA